MTWGVSWNLTSRIDRLLFGDRCGYLWLP